MFKSETWRMCAAVIIDSNKIVEYFLKGRNGPLGNCIQFDYKKCTIKDAHIEIS